MNTITVTEPADMVSRGWGKSGSLDVFFGAQSVCILSDDRIFRSIDRRRLPKLLSYISLLSTFDNDLVRAPEVIGKGKIVFQVRLELAYKNTIRVVKPGTFLAIVERAVEYTESFWEYLRNNGPSKYPTYYFNNLTTEDRILPWHSLKGYNAARSRLARIYKHTKRKVGTHLRDLIYDKRRLCWTPVDFGNLQGSPNLVVKKR